MPFPTVSCISMLIKVEVSDVEAAALVNGFSKCPAGNPFNSAVGLFLLIRIIPICWEKQVRGVTL